MPYTGLSGLWTIVRTGQAGPLVLGVMKTVMRDFAVESTQGHGQPAALLLFMGVGWVCPHSVGLFSQFLSAGQAGGDGLKSGAHSPVRKEQSMDIGRDRMEDPIL